MQIPSLKKRLLFISALLAAVLAGLIFLLSGYLFNHINKDIAQRNLNLSHAMAEHTEHLLLRPVQELAKLLELVNTPPPDREAPIQKELIDILRFNPFFQLIQLLDTNGIITHVAPFRPDHIGLDMSGHPSFKSAIGKSEPTWSDGFISSQTDALSATISVPFKQGMIIAKLNLDQLSSVLDISSIGDGGFAALIDTRGVIIAHSEPAMSDKSINIANLPSVARGLKGEEGSWEERWNRQKGLASIAFIDMNHWVIIVFQPDSESKAIVNRIERLSFFFLAACFVLVLTGQYLILRRLMRPVHKLEKQSLMVAEGLYNQKVTPYYQEFISVTNSFNIMADRIRKRELELIESEEKYRAIFEGAKEGILLVEPVSTNIHFSNRAMQQLTGYKKEVLESSNIRQLLPEKKRDTFNQSIHDLFGHFDTPVQAVPIKDALGKIHYTDISASPVKLNGSLFLAAFFTDVSQRVEMEADKANLEMQLLQTQKIEAIGVLAGGIAHDFNNILFPILGHAELLKEDLPPHSPFYPSVEEIRKASHRAKDLVQQILAFSRQSHSEVKTVLIQPVLKEALKLIRSSLPATITIDLSVDPKCGPVLADPTQIHQIIMNLVTNAFHAMQEKGGCLNVSLKAEHLSFNSARQIALNPGKYACLIFEDTGEGIKKETMDKIFDPYFTTKDVGRGTGLGLSVVQGIVKNFNGTIRISSTPGQGTTVCIFLPIISKGTVVKKEIEPGFDYSGSESILFVDDEESITQLVPSILERLGYQVTTENDGKAAFNRFKTDPNRFDLVLTDMTMPNLTGIDLAEKIKTIRPEIPVILCTGFSDRVDSGTSKNFNIEGFLKKPIVKSELARTIRQVLAPTLHTERRG